jgi:tetratricopeptide (TPR) repeat protein
MRIHLVQVICTKFSILLDSENYLSQQNINFLKKRKLSETIAIAHEKYASTLRFKVESGELLSEAEIDWLKQNQREDIITFAKQKHFTTLKKKYALVDPGNQLPFEPFYTIMLKLEKKERLDPLLVVQLIEENLLSRDGKIAIAHYKLEADFYEQEFQRTGHKWHIPNASSYFRKADEPERALQLTNLDLSSIRESNLKSAILVTRGAAFRDIGDLDNAESCAKKAIEYHPQSYQPYTLLGAIYYDKGEYSEGDDWFAEAVKRGAKTEEIDDEIKRVLLSTKDDNKRQDAVNYLLKKDSQRYAWAKSYLKKPKNRLESQVK